MTTTSPPAVSPHATPRGLLDRSRTTVASFLAYFVMASMITLAGLVAGAFADAHALEIADATARFSWYGAGVLLGSIAAIFVLDHLPPARAFQIVAVGVLASTALIAAFAAPATFGPLLALTGLFAGVGVAAAAWTISASFAPSLRASMLLITDLCFSAAGIVLGTLVPWLLAQNDQWSSVYLLVAGAAALQLLMVVGARFPHRAGSATHVSIRLPAGTLAAGLALLCYTFAQGSLMLWLPQLATIVHGADGATGGALIGRYWSGMAAGQLAIAVLALRVPNGVLLGLLALASIGLFAATALGSSIDALTRLLLALGVANSGLLKLTLAWASSWTEDPPPRLLSVLLFAATTGTPSRLHCRRAGSTPSASPLPRNCPRRSPCSWPAASRSRPCAADRRALGSTPRAAPTLPTPNETLMKLVAQALTAQDFAPFGDVIETSANCERRSINAGQTERLHDLAQLTLDADGGRPCLSIFRTAPLPLPLELTMLERHPLSSQAFVPLSGRPWLVVVAPAGEPDPRAVRAFLARGDQGVNFHPGTWHHFSLALGAPSDFIVVDRTDGAADLDEIELEDALCISLPELDA